MWGSHRSLLFGGPWPTFATVLRSYDRSKIICIPKAITTAVKPPSKLVHFEVLLASSTHKYDLDFVKVGQSSLA